MEKIEVYGREFMIQYKRLEKRFLGGFEDEIKQVNDKIYASFGKYPDRELYSPDFYINFSSLSTMYFSIVDNYNSEKNQWELIRNDIMFKKYSYDLKKTLCFKIVRILEFNIVGFDYVYEKISDLEVKKRYNDLHKIFNKNLKYVKKPGYVKKYCKKTYYHVIHCRCDNGARERLKIIVGDYKYHLCVKCIDINKVFMPLVFRQDNEEFFYEYETWFQERIAIKPAGWNKIDRKERLLNYADLNFKYN